MSARNLDGEQLLRRWSRSRDPHWRDAAIAAYMPLARRLAKRYDRGREPMDDLSQVAYIGLVKAVDRFDPDVGVRFASFAVPTITGELRRHFRDRTWAVHVPRSLQESVLRVRQATEDLTDRLGRAPTAGELSAETGLDAEQVSESMHVLITKDVSSLDQPVTGAEGESNATLGDSVGCQDAGFDLVDDRTTIAPALRDLPARDREMLYLRFALDLTQSEIAQRLGCSQMQVSRLLRRALEQLGLASRGAEQISARHATAHLLVPTRAEEGVPTRLQ